MSGQAASARLVDPGQGMRNSDDFRDSRGAMFARVIVASALSSVSASGVGSEQTSTRSFDTAGAAKISEEQSVREFISGLRNAYGYTVEVKGPWPSRGLVAPKARGRGIDKEIEEFMDAFGVSSYVIQRDPEQKKITIIVMGSTAGLPKAASNTQPPGSAQATRTASTQIEISSEELEAIEERHRQYLALMANDLAVSGPSEYGPSITVGELASIEESHRWETQLRGRTLVVSDPPDQGPGLTVGDIETMEYFRAPP